MCMFGSVEPQSESYFPFLCVMKFQTYWFWRPLAPFIEELDICTDGWEKKIEEWAPYEGKHERGRPVTRWRDWENARILSKQVKNICDIFSQSRNCCRSVCIAPVLYIAPEKIVQRTEIGSVQQPAPAPFFLSGEKFEMTCFLNWVSTTSKVRSAVCASAPPWN